MFPSIYITSCLNIYFLSYPSDDVLPRLVRESKVDAERRIDIPLEGLLGQQFVRVLGDRGHVRLVEFDQVAVRFDASGIHGLGQDGRAAGD